ncbi:hypothetical protein ACFT8V_35480 [Streptomyces griseoincarnatus]
MQLQWRTPHPLPERTVKQLRRSRWVFGTFALFESIAFTVTATESRPSAWTLTWMGFVTILSLSMLFLSQHLLRKHKQSGEGLAPIE